MFGYNEKENSSADYWGKDVSTDSKGFLGEKERNRLMKYLKRSAKYRKSSQYPKIIPNPDNDKEEILKKDEPEYSHETLKAKRISNHVLFLFILFTFLLFLRPIKSFPFAMNPMNTPVPNFQQSPYASYQNLLGQQISPLSQQYPIQTQYPVQNQYFRPQMINPIPSQNLIYNPNRFSGLNSATTFQTGLLRSQIESSIFDKLLKMVSSNIKPIIPDSQTVKSNTNNLLRAIGVNENRINLQKLDSATPDFLNGYNEAVVDIKREVDQRTPQIQYQPISSMTSYGQLPQQAISQMTPISTNQIGASISPYQMNTGVHSGQIAAQNPALNFPYTIVPTNLVQNAHTLLNKKEKDSEESGDEKPKKKSHKKKSSHDEDEEESEEEPDHESHPHHKRSHSKHRRHHRSR